MTKPTDEELIGLLTKVEGSNEWGNAPGSLSTCWHRNPDGPAAVARIKELVEERGGLREALGLVPPPSRNPQ